MPTPHDYKVIQTTGHEDLEKTLKQLGAAGWEPVLYSIYSLPYPPMHYVILRRQAS
jgi:hypothetical protein